MAARKKKSTKKKPAPVTKKKPAPPRKKKTTPAAKKKAAAARTKPAVAKVGKERPSPAAAARPKGVPAAAVWNAEENEWEIGEREGDAQVGEWTWWRPDGTLVCRSRFDAHGELDGVARRYHPDGAISLESRYVHGVRWGKTRHTRTLRGGSPEDEHMASLPANVFEVAMAYNAGEVLLVAMLNELGAKKPPRSVLGHLPDFARDIAKFEPGTAFMALGTVTDVAGRRHDATVWFYEGPAVGDFSMLRFSFTPPGARKSKTPAWQDPKAGTVVALAEAGAKLVLGVDLLDALFSPGRVPPDVGFQIELAKGVVSIRKIIEGGAAARAGLRAGDVIASMNGRRITGVVPYLEARRELAEKRRVVLGLKRGGKALTKELVIA